MRALAEGSTNLQDSKFERRTAAALQGELRLRKRECPGVKV